MDGPDSSLTYTDMINRIEAIAEALSTAGLAPPPRVLVFQEASSDWVCSMLAIMRIGGVYVPLDLRNPISRLAALVNDCQPSAVLADGTTLGDAPHLNVALVVDVSRVAPTPRLASRTLRNQIRLQPFCTPVAPQARLRASSSDIQVSETRWRGTQRRGSWAQNASCNKVPSLSTFLWTKCSQASSTAAWCT
jgi:acyl-CoA synthetase (AMP-forming)/AMP-acid ligase II